MHTPLGQSRQQTLVQLGLTFVAGAAFHVTRMTTGSRVVAVYLTGVVAVRFVATS